MNNSINSYKVTFHLIGDILSFQSNESQLRLQLHPTETDWESIVKIASNHLVLTTLYCRLKQKKLLDFIPEDLHIYIKELTLINRNRNLVLLNEVTEISTLLNTNNINHVFLKGCALLAGNYYKNVGERLIGDIDILVQSDQLEKASRLLALEGYTKSITFNYEVKNYRHLPRQVSEDKFGAVELHRHILNKKYSYLIDPKTVLSNKTIIKGVSIPSDNDLIWITILAHQVNDKGNYHNTLHYKYIYDCLVLNLDSNKVILEKLSNEKITSNFISLINVLFPEIEIFKISLQIKIRRALFKMKLKHKNFRILSYKIKYLMESLTHRISLMVYNKSYRIYILKNKIFKNS